MDKQNESLSASWFTFGDGSRLVEYSNSGGRLHSEDGPARIEYRSDGSIRYAEYWRDGSIVRSDQALDAVNASRL